MQLVSGLMGPHKPFVAGVQIGFVHRPVGVVGYGLRILLDGPPEVGHVGVEVVDRFDLRFVWS
jgi:hypothetical protein